MPVIDMRAETQDLLLQNPQNSIQRSKEVSRQTSAYGYNTAKATVDLYLKKEGIDAVKHDGRFKQIWDINQQLRDASTLSEHLKESLAKKEKADLSKDEEQKKLIDRLRSNGLFVKDTSKAYTIENKDIESQLNLIQETAKQWQQKQQLIFSDLSQDREISQQMCDLASEMIKESQALLRKIIDRTGR